MVAPQGAFFEERGFTMQSSFAGLHVALIMDGNGRWAVERGRPRSAGHRAGADVVRRMVEVAPDLGIGILTLYAFSSDNWRRPRTEVDALLRLFRRFLVSEAGSCADNGVRVNVIGRRDRLGLPLRRAIGEAETATRNCTRLLLRIAVDYSARHMILQAARQVGGRELSAAGFGVLLSDAQHGIGPAPEVDLMVRTGRERRLSDFLLWECAYAELYFSDCMWPDFSPADLRAAVDEFHRRNRRFGRLLDAAAGQSAARNVS